MAMTLPVPDLFVRGRAMVGEGPVHDHRLGELVWVDIPAGACHRTSLADGTAVRTSTVGQSLGAVAVRERGGFVAAVGDGFATLDERGTLSVAEPVLPEPDRRMNDAKCDSAGRFWAGSTSVDFRPGEGVLHCWDPAGGVCDVLRGLTLPNGLGWSPDDTGFYLVDSMRRTVFAAAYDVDGGRLGPLGEMVRLDASDGLPDGLCVDTDGYLWLAVWGAGEVRRYDPAGRLAATIRMPVSKPTSCAFGPEGMLFITSAAEGTSPGVEPLAGSVFALPTAHAGAAVGAFAG